MVKFLVVEKMFEEILICILKDNMKNTNIDLFQKKMVALA